MKRTLKNILFCFIVVLTTLSCSKSNNPIESEAIKINHRFYFKDEKGYDLLTDVKLDEERQSFYIRLQVDKSAFYEYDAIEAHIKTKKLYDTNKKLNFIRNPFKDIVNYGAREYTLFYKFTSPTVFGDTKVHTLTVKTECFTPETTDNFTINSATMGGYEVEVFDVPNSNEKGFIITDKR